jgi:hypothetical protein
LPADAKPITATFPDLNLDARNRRCRARTVRLAIVSSQHELLRKIVAMSRAQTGAPLAQ